MLLAGSRAIVVVLCLILMRKIVFIYNMKGKHRFFFNLYVKAHSLLYDYNIYSTIITGNLTINLEFKELASEAIAASCMFLAPYESSDLIIFQSQS